MSTNIKVQRICQFCGSEFTARTTVTRYCTQRCASKAYKVRERIGNVEASNKETLILKNKPLLDAQMKDFLTVREVSALLSCSVRTVYQHIGSGQIKAVNFGRRITRVRRTDLERLFQ